MCCNETGCFDASGPIRQTCLLLMRMRLAWLVVLTSMIVLHMDLDAGLRNLEGDASHQASPVVTTDHGEFTVAAVTEGKHVGTTDASLAKDSKPLEAAVVTVASAGSGSHPMDIDEPVEEVEKSANGAKDD